MKFIYFRNNLLIAISICLLSIICYNKSLALNERINDIGTQDLSEYIIGLKLGEDYELDRQNRINEKLKRALQIKRENDDILKFLQYDLRFRNGGALNHGAGNDVANVNDDVEYESDRTYDYQQQQQQHEQQEEENELIDELISTIAANDEEQKDTSDSSSESTSEEDTTTEDIIINVSPKVLEELIAEVKAEADDEKAIEEIIEQTQTPSRKDLIEIEETEPTTLESTSSSSSSSERPNDNLINTNEALINKDLNEKLTKDYFEPENIINEILSKDKELLADNSKEEHIIPPTYTIIEESPKSKKTDELNEEISDNNNDSNEYLSNKNNNNNDGDYNDNKASSSSSSSSNNGNEKEETERFIIPTNDNNHNQQQQQQNEQKLIKQEIQQQQQHDEKENQINDSTNTNTDDDYPYVHIETEKKFETKANAIQLLHYIAKIFNLQKESFQNISIKNNQVSFILKSETPLNTELFIKELEQKRDDINSKIDVDIVSLGVGRDNDPEVKKYLETRKSKYVFIAIVAICVSVSTLLFVLTALYVVKRRSYLRHKLDTDSFEGKIEKYHEKSEEKTQLTQDYQELCRQRMQTQSTGDQNNSASQSRVTSVNSNDPKQADSTRSSTSSWSEEPITTVNMDISTGHIILTYMEEHLNDKSRINNEWESLCKYVPDLTSTEIANSPVNAPKNRYSNVLPYDHTRVILRNEESDYINASTITDHDPKHAAYIATQGPLVHTACDFWRMVWEQSSMVIVCLCKTNEYGAMKCSQYWPSAGCEVYDKFEVNLISEHLWCEDYLIRSFYLKHKETSETRTVTQFHFLSWPENDVPQSIKSVLDFRRKVNKSYKGKSCPVIVHCNDGIGRTGTYVLIDMVLNKITKGAKEIDIAATLEFLRDQRPGMVTNKTQFEFAFAVITEELQNMLKVLNPQ